MLGASCTKAESVNMLQTQHTCRVTEFGKQEKGTEFDLKFELENVQISFSQHEIHRLENELIASIHYQHSSL